MKGKELLDFGLEVRGGKFQFFKTHCVAPSSLVLAYSLAVVTSGKATRILMAGFDGYAKGDARNDEVEDLLNKFNESGSACELFSITPTKYRNLLSRSIYAI